MAVTELNVVHKVLGVEFRFELIKKYSHYDKFADDEKILFLLMLKIGQFRIPSLT